MKTKPYGAQNTKFLEYERSSLIPLTSSELLKFENRTSVIIEISRFSGHRCPGINEGVFDFKVPSNNQDCIYKLHKTPIFFQSGLVRNPTSAKYWI